jgi:hypothetical protein
MNEWKQTGVQYYLNGRTKQEMPLYYQLYEDYLQNEERLNIQKALSGLSIPVLLCHGTKDEAVPVDKAHLLKKAKPHAELFLVESDHVFGRKHPWKEDHLPVEMQQVADKALQFFKTAATMLFILFLSSCVPFGKGPGYVHCCSFNTATTELSFTCKDEKLKVVRVLLLSGDPNKFSEGIAEYRVPGETSIIKLDTIKNFYAQQRSILIKIWAGSPVIDDYRIEITPKDWNSKSTVFASPNYR